MRPLLQEASEALRAKGITIETKLCDVSKADEIDALADLALSKFGQVNVVCSNAGVGLPTSARNMKLSDWEWILNVDLWGPIHGQDLPSDIGSRDGAHQCHFLGGWLTF